MRVIAGAARGIRLLPVPGDLIRPTSDRVRESLFNILAPRLSGCRFLDLFTGTGANGIEALSRGAGTVVLVDEARESLTIVRDNLVRTKLTGDVHVHQLNLPRQLAHIRPAFDIIFADPPYAFHQHEALLQGITEAKLLAPEGVFVLEHAKKTMVPESVGPLSRVREAKYGNTSLSLYA